jgi:type VI protein secretion system component VasK
VGAAVTSIWVPEALTYSLMGLGGGCLLGLLGLAWSRWEATSGSLHYTPNRLLVLAITLVVTSRLLYGFWRAWQTWRSSPEDVSWVVSAGVAGSLAAGAVVLGYYLTYWIGVRRRLTQHRRKQAAMEAGNRARRVPGRRV